MRRIIDLTLTCKTDMRGVSWTPARTIPENGWNARTLSLYSHAGTHMDAPRHFSDEPDAGTIDAIDLRRCVGTALLIDIPNVQPKEILTVERLGAAADLIKNGARLLLKTGWSARAEEPSYREELPRIGEELARWIAERGVHFLGVEPPSVARVQDREELTRIHRILLDAGVVIVEGLANLDALSTRRPWIAALPLKIDGGDGSPCRVVAIEETNGETDA